jgi:cytochrome c-type biogenesis protein CcmH/NrfG
VVEPVQAVAGAGGCVLTVRDVMAARRATRSRRNRITLPMVRLALLAAASLFFCGALARPASAVDPPGTPLSRDALATCHRAQATPADADAEALLAQSLDLARRAVSADPDDALAHFARFCALGEQARRSGASLSSLVKLGAIRDAVDRTLQIAPDFPDALLGKGAFLCSVPRLLGGDPTDGERLVRRALEIDPDYVGARLFLAERLLERGDRARARSEAERARSAAEHKNDPDGVRDATSLIARTDDQAARDQRPGKANSSARLA